MAKKKLNIIPVAGNKNRVFIQPAEAEKVTAGGIIIPDSAQEKPQKGTVVAVSELDEDGKTPVVKVGDIVMYSKYAGTELPHEGVTYLSMRESDIIAKIV